MLKNDGPVKISLTQFVNFAIKSPPQQLTAVRAIRKQHDSGYEVPPDLYKQFRDGIVRHHMNNRSKEDIDIIALSQTEPTRQKEYTILVNGYKKFLGRKLVTWFKPAQGIWRYGGLEINIRPELGLAFNERKLLLKLYPNQPDREEGIDKRKAEFITHLMGLAFPDLPQNTIPCILDVRRGKLFEPGKTDREQTVLLQAQARSFVEIYRNL